MGAAENVERPLEIAIVGERPAVTGEQRLVAGVGDGGLLEDSDGLGALPGGAERLTVPQGGLGIPRIGAIALAIDFDAATRIGVGSGIGLSLRADRSRDVTYLQPPRLAAKVAVTA
jgi:hypothetical protein